MRYIDAELLKAEIERMRKINRKAFEADHINSDIYHGRVQAINNLFKFIDSLQQEQPCDTCTNDKGCVTCKDGELWEGKEQSSEDLEEAAEKFVYDWAGLSPTERRIAERAYLAGAEWMAKRLKK